MKQFLGVAAFESCKRRVERLQSGLTFGLAGTVIVLMLGLTTSTVSAAQPIYATANDSVRLLVDSATQQLQSGQTDVASLTLERALRIEPENPALWYLLARIQYVDDDWSESLSLGQRSVSFAADHPELLTHIQKLFNAISLASQGQKLSLKEIDTMNSVDSVADKADSIIITDDSSIPAAAVVNHAQSLSPRPAVLVEPIKEPRLHARRNESSGTSHVPALISNIEQSKGQSSQVVERSFSIQARDETSKYSIPNEAMPSPGYCRLWYDNRGADSQPPAVACEQLNRRIPVGARLIMGRSRR